MPFKNDHYNWLRGITILPFADQYVIRKRLPGVAAGADMDLLLFFLLTHFIQYFREKLPRSGIG